MSISKSKVVKEVKDSLSIRTIDLAGGIWRHFNPVELYRFIKTRTDLLRTINAICG